MVRKAQGCPELHDELGGYSRVVVCSFTENSRDHFFLLHSQNFPKNEHFLPPDTQTHMCGSGGREKC